MHLGDAVKAKFPNVTTAAYLQSGDPVVVIRKEGIKAVAAALRDDPDYRFEFLMDLSAVDYLHWEDKAVRFEVVYNLYSRVFNRRLFVKAEVPEAEAEIDSVTSLWPAANWYEREVWDMFGIRFKGHLNLKRILMYEGFEGHPLRKDYPYNRRQPKIGPLN
jgi:NADH-quinone oxidoreductase subunit C